MVSRGDRSLRLDCPARSGSTLFTRGVHLRRKRQATAEQPGGRLRRAPSLHIVAGASWPSWSCSSSWWAASRWPCCHDRWSPPRTRPTGAEADLAQAQDRSCRHQHRRGPGLHRRRPRPMSTAAHHDAQRFRRRRVESVVPVAGSAVHDARHLVDALDEATTVGEIGDRDLPGVSDPGLQLVTGKQIDLPASCRRWSTDRLEHRAPTSTQAQSDVNEVQGNTPFVGGAKIATLRDEAARICSPLQDSYDQGRAAGGGSCRPCWAPTAPAPTCSR